MKCTLIIDKRRALKDGSYPIKISVGNGTRLYLSTGLSCQEKDWDEKSMKIISKGSRTANEALAVLVANTQDKIIDLIQSGRINRIDKSELKNAFKDIGHHAKRITFHDIAIEFIETRNRPRTKELYEQTIKKVDLFDKGCTLEEMKPSWLTAFDGFLGGHINGRAIHLRNIRAIFNYALDNELTTYYPFRKFRIKYEETRKRHLTVEQLRQYVSLTCLSPSEQEYRDMFLLIFYLIGINITDLAHLTEKSIVDGRIEYQRAKTGKLYSIKIQPEAQEIIDKYKGKDHLLLPFDRYVNYKDYLHHLNDCLGKLGPTIGRYNNGTSIMRPIERDCTTYWARHTWATIAYEIGTPDEFIAAALGHSYGNRTTAIYIDKRVTRVDDINRAVIDYVLNKKKASS